MLPGQAPAALVARSAMPAVETVRTGDAPPTAFAALARSAAQRASEGSGERPSEPAVLAPAGGGSAAMVPDGIDFAGAMEVDMARSLRAANRRVLVLRAVVIGLVVLNLIVVAVASVALFTGAGGAGPVS